LIGLIIHSSCRSDLKAFIFRQFTCFYIHVYVDANKNNDGDAGDGESSNLPPAEPLEPDFLAALKPIDLLPLERTLTLFEAPNATITFMDGSPQVASDWLRSRVSEVVYRNPWLGGYLGKDKSRGGAVSLFYDPSSDEVNTDVFTSFDPGAIDLTRETKYEDFGGEHVSEGLHEGVRLLVLDEGEDSSG